VVVLKHLQLKSHSLMKETVKAYIASSYFVATSDELLHARRNHKRLSNVHLQYYTKNQ